MRSYNAATDNYENLFETGIIDPTKVIRCALENSSSVARTFLTADAIVTEIPDPAKEAAEAAAAAAGGGGMAPVPGF